MATLRDVEAHVQSRLQIHLTQPCQSGLHSQTQFPTSFAPQDVERLCKHPHSPSWLMIILTSVSVLRLSRQHPTYPFTSHRYWGTAWCYASNAPVARSAHALQRLRAVEISTRHRRSHGAGAPCAAWKASGRGVLLGALPGGHGLTAAAHTMEEVSY